VNREFLIQIRIGSRLNIFKLVIKLISELTAKDAKNNDKANFKNNQRFLKTVVIFLFIITTLNRRLVHFLRLLRLNKKFKQIFM